MTSHQTTKKFFNDVQSFVDDNIRGYLALHPGLCMLEGHRVILRHDFEKYAGSKKVCILTGGGSGHEPAFAGYVGEGMACGTIQGAMFASPGPAAVLAAIKAVDSPTSGGVIMIFNNYTGDRLNFGLAMERAKAQGIKVGIILNADDCAIIGKDRTAGRRGLAGFILLLKIVGGMAEEGKSFEEIMSSGQKLADGIATLGVCTYPCSMPGSGYLFQLQPDEMVIGLGLHGETGIQTSKMMTAHDTVATILDKMTDPKNRLSISLNAGESVAVLLNNLGSTSETEMNILIMETITQLEKKGVKVDRAYMSRYATSQEMAGFSITLLRLDDALKHYLDLPTNAPAWMKPILPAGVKDRFTRALIRKPQISEGTSDNKNVQGAKIDDEDADRLLEAIVAGCRGVIAACDELNKLDSTCGDGDCGSTLRDGAEAILAHVDTNLKRSANCPSNLCMHISEVLENSMGGCSGALYSLLFTSAATVLRSAVTLKTVSKALLAGITSMQTYGGAQPGDRTMLDPLHAAFEALNKSIGKSTLKETLMAVIQAVTEASDATAKMEARAGRASYVGVEHQILPDAGARAVYVWMTAALNTFITHCV